MSDRPLLVAISDIHLRNSGRYLFASRPFIQDDLIVAIDEFCRLVEQLKPKGVVVSGDFFHSKQISAGDLELAMKIIDVCKANCDELFYVQGQHDRFEPHFISVLNKKAIYLNDLEFKFYGYTLRGLDYHLNPLEVIYDIPEADIFVTHQTWKERPNEVFGTITIQELTRRFRLTICGDIHTHAIYRVDGKIEKLFAESGRKWHFPRMFVSPGPLCLQKLDIKEKCGVAVVWDDLSVQSVFLPGRIVAVERFYSDVSVRDFIEKRLPQLLTSAQLLPEPIRPIIVLAKCIEPLPQLHELAQLLEGKGFVFFAFEKLQHSNPTVDMATPKTIQQIINEIFEANVHKEYILRLFDAAKHGRLDEELSAIAKQLKPTKKGTANDASTT